MWMVLSSGRNAQRSIFNTPFLLCLDWRAVYPSALLHLFTTEKNINADLRQDVSRNIHHSLTQHPEAPTKSTQAEEETKALNHPQQEPLRTSCCYRNTQRRKDEAQS